MKFEANGELTTERIVVNVEAGSVTFNKCDANGRPGDVERVLTIFMPLRFGFL